MSNKVKLAAFKCKHIAEYVFLVYEISHAAGNGKSKPEIINVDCNKKDKCGMLHKGTGDTKDDMKQCIHYPKAE